MYMLFRSLMLYEINYFIYEIELWYILSVRKMSFSVIEAKILT